MIRKNIAWVLFGLCLRVYGQVTPEDFVLQDGVLLTYTGTEPTVVIPEELGVTEIGERAFALSGVTSVTIPAGVVRIRDWAFWGCAELTDIALPEGLTAIGDWAFLGCAGLTSIRFPDTLTGIGDWTFGNCPNLALIEVGEENPAYTVIDGVLFDKTGMMLLVYPGGNPNPDYAVPEQTALIRNLAFSSAVNVTAIRIPAEVSYIGNLAFYGCIGLAGIEVDPANAEYRSIDGVLFDKTGETLLAYPAGNTRSAYAVPDGVKTIGERAFYGCSGFSHIDLPKSVTAIGGEAFQACAGLVNMQIPDSIVSIGTRAFSYCTSLVAVNIPSRVASIGDQAFYGCSALSLILVFKETRMGKDVFEAAPGQLTYLN